MKKYDHKKIEKKWQKEWEKKGLYNRDICGDDKKPKYYVLDMFPYPSGDGLHMGHTESYTASDIIYRYKRLQGFDVLHPQGFDSFGLPAENYAVKTGVHPKETTKKNTDNYIKQMKMLGLGHDLDHLIYTSDPSYYKWTQWLFGKFFENGLVEQKTDKINWCPSCNTGIANEQVENGKCERCKTEIEQKEVPGWFFKITDFAEDLIEDLDKVDWPEATKKNQRNWIGKSEGATLNFEVRISNFDSNSNDKILKNKNSDIQSKLKIKNSKLNIEVFTTRPDTLFGVTYLVLAPEHSFVKQILFSCHSGKQNFSASETSGKKFAYPESTHNESEIPGRSTSNSPDGERSANFRNDIKVVNCDEVIEYVERAKNKTEMERLESKEKTGVKLEGIVAVNPANGEEIPIFVADYVLSGYGTGAIMAVPAHDERDFEFAKKYNLPIKQVIESKNSEQRAMSNRNKNRGVYTGSGKLINSGKFDGMDSEEAKKAITEFVGGEMTTNYRLRDWSISRQRYWGCPIPIVYSPEGEAKFVGGENLPWLLPEDVDFVPDGTAPLAKSKELKERTEKIFGKGWTPEVDTMDTFVDSSWYFLRYPDTENDKEFCSKEKLKRWLPVDLYIGGAEHTYMHLLYARFFVKAMHKMGLLEFDEPFMKLRHQGMVLDKNGVKMSKSKGNVVNPNDMVERFGADATRLNMMFAGPLEEDVMWKEESVKGVYRFLEKVWRLFQEKNLIECGAGKCGDVPKEVPPLFHKTIKKVTEDIENMNFNTAISQMMIFVNECTKHKTLPKSAMEKFLILLAPFVPHIAEELWAELGYEETIFDQQWPEYNPDMIKDEMIEMVVQVNGKVRDKIQVSADISEEGAKEKALASDKIQKYIDGKEIKKTIFVPGRLMNLVV